MARTVGSEEEDIDEVGEVDEEGPEDVDVDVDTEDDDEEEDDVEEEDDDEEEEEEEEEEDDDDDEVVDVAPQVVPVVQQRVGIPVAKEDHRTLNRQVNQYFHNIQQFASEEEQYSSVLDLSSLNNEFQIDPTLSGLKTPKTQTSSQEQPQPQQLAAAAVLALQRKKEGERNDEQADKRAPSAQMAGAVPVRPVPVPVPVPPVAVKVAAPAKPKRASRGRPYSRQPAPLPDLTADERATLLPVPEGVDPKKMCRLCGKTFAHAGSLGRHLDHHKGAPGHPAGIIEKLRANVARRGDPEAVKARRQVRAREYNRREYVKAKNRERRKITSKAYRVKENTQLKFYRDLNTPHLDPDASFGRLVLFFLPPGFWPADPPRKPFIETVLRVVTGSTTRKAEVELMGFSVESLKATLTAAYDRWHAMTGQIREDIWNREIRKCAWDALGGFSLMDFASREAYATKLSEAKKEQLQDVDDDQEEGEEGVDSLGDEELAAVAAAAEAAVKREFN